MAKTKTVFYCRNCGAQFSQWLGQCTQCKEWNTIAEEIIERNSHKESFSDKKNILPQQIHEISSLSERRISTLDNEFNSVLGGGIVLGSVILLGGEPGIGKSTLLLQLALKLKHIKVLYVSGEESANQIKMRAERLINHNSECYIYTETSTQKIFKQAQELQPQFIIIDSIQTLHSSYIEATAGSVSQIRECAAECIRFAKETNVPIFLIGHITKDGQIAGPKILEHMVDVVLQFEGDRNHLFRLLRTQKNRYGSTQEVGIYEMNYNGLSEVANPSEILISKREENLSGNAISVTLEGIRTMLIEVQALVSTSVYATPQRSATGFDAKRLNMLLAVLEKRAGFHLASKDVFLNITGGIKVDDPALDLAVAAAILSSAQDIELPEHSCFAAEIGLSGEVRSIPRIEARITEAQKLGYKSIIISKYNAVEAYSYRIKIHSIATIQELKDLVLC